MKPVSLLTLALISSAAAQVMPPGMPQGMQMMQMAAPSPPRPGDASMTCEQIAREMGEFIKKSDISKNAAQNRKAGCALRGTSSLSAAEQNRATATVMGNAMTTMSTFNNPRLMRLGDRKSVV